jgi:hypothetical protein
LLHRATPLTSHPSLPAAAAPAAQVTCLTKDNIMKITDGLFSRAFRDAAAAHPGIEAEHLLVDIGAARIAARPEDFDVVVAPNLYGDIVSDIAAEARRALPIRTRAARIGRRTAAAWPRSGCHDCHSRADVSTKLRHGGDRAARPHGGALAPRAQGSPRRNSWRTT